MAYPSYAVLTIIFEDERNGGNLRIDQEIFEYGENDRFLSLYERLSNPSNDENNFRYAAMRVGNVNGGDSSEIWHIGSLSDLT